MLLQELKFDYFTVEIRQPPVSAKPRSRASQRIVACHDIGCFCCTVSSLHFRLDHILNHIRVYYCPRKSSTKFFNTKSSHRLPIHTLQDLLPQPYSSITSTSPKHQHGEAQLHPTRARRPRARHYQQTPWSCVCRCECKRSHQAISLYITH